MAQIVLKIGLGGVVLLVCLFVLHWLQIRWTGAPAGLGVTNGRLAPCPQSPNCVTTEGGHTPYQRLDPLPYQADEAVVMAELRAIIEEMPQAAVVTMTDTYIHAEFRSPGMGYVDDVEFYLDTETHLIHFRSASRLGYGDMNANRDRMKKISRQLIAREV